MASLEGDGSGLPEVCSAKVLVDKSIAPIKSEYLVKVTNAHPQGQSQSQMPSKKQQRTQRKKEFLKQSFAMGRLCSKFMLHGSCDVGEKCKFSHDVEKFLSEKPMDLPGRCPFSKAEDQCRYGIMCRWSSTHVKNPTASSAWTGPEDGTRDSSEERDSGTIPRFVELPVQSEIHDSINSLSKEMQRKLRKNEYDFSKVDDCLTQLGIKISRPSKVKRMKPNPRDPENEDQRPAAQSQCMGTMGRVESIPIGTGADSCLREKEKPSFDFRGKTYLSPLTTLGNLPFRRVCVGLGVDITCGEMALATNLLQANTSEWALLKRHPCEKSFGVQVCGGYADALSRCAALIEDEATVDFVDVNMGCPIDSICDRCAGASLLRKTKKMEEILKGMSQTLSCPLTIKIRKGYDDKYDIAHKFLPSVGNWGACAVTLHGRSRQQRYSRSADWDYIHMCADLVSDVQLIGNGDIFSPQDWNRHQEKGNLVTCMIGRGALIKPWIFTEIKENRLWDISAGERLDIIKEFCSFGLEHWGSDMRGIETTRRFLLEWLSFLYRYVPVGLLEVVPQHIQWRPQAYFGRNDLETLLASDKCEDWIRISSFFLGPPPESFTFKPKHVSNAYVTDPTGAPLVSQTGEQENG